MRKLHPKVAQQLEKYAEFLGSEDCGPIKGGQNRWLGENKRSIQMKHIFYIKNTELEGQAGAIVPGHVIPDLIREDRYEVKYIGQQPLDKNAKKVLKECEARIERDVLSARAARNERLCIFPEVESSDEEKE